jgi:hypothetical protein
LQEDRESLSRTRLQDATYACRKAKAAGEPFDIAKFGSEFSAEYLSVREETLARRGGEAIAQFDRAWKAKVRSQAA